MADYYGSSGWKAESNPEIKGDLFRRLAVQRLQENYGEPNFLQKLVAAIAKTPLGGLPFALKGTGDFINKYVEKRR
jgi:hypothetical protein